MPAFYANLNMAKNELQNARIQNLASAPGSPVIGQIYFDTTQDAFMVYTSGGWMEMADASASMVVHDNTFHSVDYEDSANKGVANGYAGLDAQAKVPLAQLPDAAKSQTYVVADSTARDAITGMLAGDKAYETSTGDSYIYDGTQWVLMADADWENVNLDWTNITNPPTILELGETSTTAYRGDHGLIAYNHSQTAHAPADAQKNSDILKSEIEAVLTGEITTHTHPSETRKHAADIGDGVQTSYTVTHSFNTRDVTVLIRETASPYAQVFADVEMTTVDAITVKFATAPTTNQFRVIVTG